MQTQPLSQHPLPPHACIRSSFIFEPSSLQPTLPSLPLLTRCRLQWRRETQSISEPGLPFHLHPGDGLTGQMPTQSLHSAGSWLCSLHTPAPRFTRSHHPLLSLFQHAPPFPSQPLLLFHDYFVKLLPKPMPPIPTSHISSCHGPPTPRLTDLPTPKV